VFVKPFACPTCDYRGTTRSHLNSHLRRHAKLRETALAAVLVNDDAAQ
jgi:uncharacterized Zn-finger protein